MSSEINQVDSDAKSALSSAQTTLTNAEYVLRDILDRHPKVQKTPEPLIKVHKLNNSSIDIATRPWVNPYDYWEVYWDINREVKLRFDEESIIIPYPQLDIHHHSN